MDLIELVLGLAIIGFVLYLIQTKIPMDPFIKTAIYVIIFIVLVIYLVRRFGSQIPNVMN